MNEAQVATPEIYNQGIFNSMTLPINGDYIAVSYAIKDLLKEGWIFSGIIKTKNNDLIPSDAFYVELTREWKC